MSDDKTKLTPEERAQDEDDHKIVMGEPLVDDQANTKSEVQTEVEVHKQTNSSSDSGSDGVSVQVSSVTPENKPEQAQQANQGRQNLLLVVILLVLICSTIAGSYLLWNELQQTKTDLFDYVTNEKATSGITAEKFAAMGETIKQVEQKQIEQALAMASLYREKQGNNEDWAIAEVEYLLIIALHRLLLEENVNTAFAALEAADLRLRDLDNPGLLPVRRQLAADMNQLRSVNVPDTAGMAIYLSDMVELSNELPLKEQIRAATYPSSDGDNTIDNSATPVWKRLPLILWQEIKSLIVIKRAGEVKQALLLPGEEYFLYQNLRLELESARLSVLRSDSKNLRASINLIQSWLRQYFDISDAAVINVIETLDRMRPIELKPDLPDISSSLESLRAYSREADSESSANSEIQ